jgi:hypothetical protein
MLGLACTAETAFAQRRGFSSRSSVLSVATVPAVAKKLKLTDEQTTLAKKLREEVNKIREETYQGFGDLSDEEKNERRKKYYDQRQEKEQQLAKSVGEKKIKRIRQLGLQAGGFLSAIFSRGETREKLEISDEQRTQAFGELRGMREEFTAAGDDAEALAELYKKADEKIAAVLTDDQKSKWKKMLGEPAEEELLAKIRAAGRRRRRS